MKKSILIIIACFVSVFAFQAFTTSHQPRYTNLKILPQDISKDALDSVMHHFKTSLGVKCSFCHVFNPATKKMNFPSDEKPEKQVARKMMLMAIDINKNHFQQIEETMDSGKMALPRDTSSVSYMLKYVTCYTCHRGDPHPDNQPPKEMEEHHMPMPQGAPQNKQ